MELEVLNWIVMVVLGIGGWLMRNMVSHIQEDIRNVKVDIEKLKQEKLSKDDFKDFKVELREMFNEIKVDIRDLKGFKGPQ